MGGQVGDRGVMKYLDGETIDIFDTKRENGVTVHLTKELTTENYIQSAVRLIVDEEARQATSCNHTATHLLHEALREVLGSHVEQRGSYVSPEVLRFDFSHFQKLTPEEIEKVEKLANKAVRRAIPRDEHRCVPIDKAREMGAMALFGEKYGDEVRVIRYGSSIELCGGTHVENTGNIGMIKIISESSIAAGIRRIEAITGERVEEAINNVNNTMKEISAMFNNAPNLIQTLRKSIDENAELRRQAEEYFTERINNLTDKLLSSARVINGTKVVELTGIRLPEVAKGVAFAVRAKSPEHTVFIGTTVDPSGKPLLTVMITDDLVKDGLNASATVREAAKQIQGGGGGQPGFAQAGGKNKDGITSAYEKIKEILSL